MTDLTAVIHVRVPDVDGDDVVRLYHRLLSSLIEGGLSEENIGITTMYGPPSKALHPKDDHYDIGGNQEE